MMHVTASSVYNDVGALLDDAVTAMDTARTTLLAARDCYHAQCATYPKPFAPYQKPAVAYTPNTPSNATKKTYRAPNGMNLSQSVGKPTSRFTRIYTYLSLHGEATKNQILLEVFGKQVGRDISQGWGCYVFGLGVKNGYFSKVRKNHSTYWTITATEVAL